MVEPYYRPDLALVHHRGFSGHADTCAPGILALLEQVRGGVVLELGCGSGALTRHLVSAGHRVIATDASPAMVALVAQQVPDADARRLVLPYDQLPEADAVVSVGHVLSYLADEAAIEAALVACARALLPGGVLAVDLADRSWITGRTDLPNTVGRSGEDWAVLSELSSPAPNALVRTITTFVRNDDGTWRRDDERHHNTLIDTSRVPALLAAHGVEAAVRAGFGDEVLTPSPGLVAIVGRRISH
ncbi:MAG TPA: class I SAM-dependent methyltransferase [Acidimicrobiales bacterium]